jgi:TolB-like protein/Tfp pilus assembly protein PilF
MHRLLAQLKERRIWRVLVAYPSVVFVLLQAVEFFINNYDLDGRYLTASLLASVVLFPAAVVWNWRHGEVGHQQVSASEVGVYVVSLAAVIGAMSWYWLNTPADTRVAAHDRDPARSVAVMPFANVGDVGEVQYLCDGIAESLINWLATVPDIKVVSKGASFRLRDSMYDTARLADEFDVDSVITGELEIVNGKVVVSARMVDARDESQIWGARLVQPSDDVIFVERSIVAAIKDGLRLNIESDSDLRTSGGTDDAVAYKHYLQGHYLIQSTNPESIDQGIEELREAIRIDPQFALPYADIADSFSQALSYGLLDDDELVGEARNAAYTAIALAPDLPEAHGALATIHQYYDFDWAAADAAYEAAVALLPQRPGVFHRYTDYLVLTHRFERAKDMASRAIALDPLDSSSLHAVGLARMMAGEFEAGAEAFGEWNRFHPGSRWSYIKHALALSLAGNCTESLSQADRVDAMYDGNAPSLQESWLAWGYKNCGNDEAYERSLERIREAQRKNPNSFDPGLTYLNALEGNDEEFVQVFERVIAERAPFVAFAKLFSLDYIGLDVAPKLAVNDRYLAMINDLNFPPGDNE